MSLVASIRVGTDIVVAADSRVHFTKTGYYLDNARKISSCEGRIAIGWVGYQDLSATVIENFEKMLFKKSSTHLDEDVSVFQQVAVAAYRDFALFTGQAQAKANFLIAGFDGSKARIYLCLQDESFVPVCCSDSAITTLGTDEIAAIYLSNLEPFIDSTDKAIKSLVFAFAETSKHYVNVSSQIDIWIVSQNHVAMLPKEVTRNVQAEMSEMGAKLWQELVS